MSDHPECALLDEYVLGTLDRRDAIRVADHLKTCAACRCECDELRSVVDVLPLALAPSPAPSALRDRILAAADVPRSRFSAVAVARGLAAALIIAVAGDVFLALRLGAGRAVVAVATPTAVAAPVATTAATSLFGAAVPEAHATGGLTTIAHATGGSTTIGHATGGPTTIGHETSAARPALSPAPGQVAPRSSAASSSAFARASAAAREAAAHEAASREAASREAAAREAAARGRAAHDAATIAQLKHQLALFQQRSRVDRRLVHVLEGELARAQALPRVVAVAAGSVPVATSTPTPAASPAVSGPAAASRPPDDALVSTLRSGKVYAIDGAVGGEPWHLTILQPREGERAVIYSGTPDAPSGQTYRTWVLRSGRTVNVGELVPGKPATLEMPMALEPGDVVAFSREPIGTGDLPTQPFLMQLKIGQ